MSSRKNLEIEYLRGAAVAMTLLSHVNMLLPFHVDVLLRIFSIFMPWTGVDLFFCISGFVVSKAYLDYFDKHRAQGQFGLAAACFWLRRAYRLLLTAWLWILIPLIFSIAFNQSNIFGSWFDNLRSFTAVATFSGNLANQYNSLLGPSPQYWSLALEEQFYFVFPFFLLFITAPRWRVIALFALIALQFGLDRNPFGNPASSMLSSFRLDAMLWGILLCLFTRTRLYQQIEPVGLGQGMLKPLLCTLFLLYMLGAIATQLIAVPIAVGLIAIVAVLIVWLASYQKGYIYCPAVLRLHAVARFAVLWPLCDPRVRQSPEYRDLDACRRQSGCTAGWALYAGVAADIGGVAIGAERTQLSLHRNATASARRRDRPPQVEPGSRARTRRSRRRAIAGQIVRVAAVRGDEHHESTYRS